MPRAALLELRPEGLWCAAGGFFIDPWRPVERALITHGHADHARSGHGAYLASAAGEGVLRARLGDIALQTLPWGVRLRIGDVEVSFHPAAHVLGASQIRIAHRGEVWVVTGDYRVESDRTCDAFEPVPAHTLVTESTFGLPIYRWRPQAQVMDEILAWWQANAAAGRASVIYAYALGKAQRLLAGLQDAAGGALPGPLLCHAATETLNAVYRAAGIDLPSTQSLQGRDPMPAGALVLAPPASAGAGRLKSLGEHEEAFVSGWMQLRGPRRRRGVDRGFVLSDHADWPGLLQAIEGSGAERVLVTHGSSAVLVRWLREHGREAEVLGTPPRAQDGEDAA